MLNLTLTLTLTPAVGSTLGANPDPKVFGTLPPGGGATLTTLTLLGGGSDPPSSLVQSCNALCNALCIGGVLVALTP